MKSFFLREHHKQNSAFTLIELLVVIAIIAILAVVVVLTLNPAQLLAQSRDSQRVSDMSTLNSAIALYQTDQSSASSSSLGNTSSAYLSLPDSSSTCGTWGFTSGYACASSTSSRNVNGSGWIPLNFSAISSGSPLGSLPVDPTNQSSSGLYYTYTTNGSQYQLISLMESTKYKTSVAGPLGNGIDVEGSNAGSAPVGWWPLNEGTGTIAIDESGNGNNGTWSGTATGTSGYYSPGYVSTWAGDFDGSTDYVNVGSNSSLAIGSYGTLTAWIYPYSSWPSYAVIVQLYGTGIKIQRYVSTNELEVSDGTHISYGGTITTNAWNYISVAINNGVETTYINGVEIFSGAVNNPLTTPTISFEIGYADHYFSGLISDVRIYNRALSPAEIKAIYNAKD